MVVHHCIDLHPPWQQGRTERTGGLLKEQIVKATNHLGGINDSEFPLVICDAVEARNRYVNRSGFSAHRRVFGRSLGLPMGMHLERP